MGAKETYHGGKRGTYDGGKRESPLRRGWRVQERDERIEGGRVREKMAEAT